MRFAISLVFTCSFLFGFSQIKFTESSSAQNINVSHGDNIFIGGLSFFDFDQDGWDDLTFSSETDKPLYFFKNNNGTFQSVTLNLTDYEKDSRQMNWVDIDNDGDLDFFVAYDDAMNRLYENDGSMNFTDITTSAGLDTTDIQTWGSSWGDYDKDGDLDLFLSSRDLQNNSARNYLYRNNGNKTFTDVTAAAGIDTGHQRSFCASFFDYNNDGWQDIYIANDRIVTPNLLYKNNGDGTFTDVSSESGTDLLIDAMSTTIDDYNNDGWLDIYVTNTLDGNSFLRNNGDGTFTDIAATNGTQFNSIAWGAVFLDADNDTDQDLYVSGSFDNFLTYLSAAFYENNGSGSYSIPLNAGFQVDLAVSYSNAIGDVNNDGYPDISVLNIEPDDNYLWINECYENVNNNWLKVKLNGTVGNKMGIGSWIEIMADNKKQYRYTLCGEGYVSQNSGAEFFGVGDATEIDYVKVTWLSGIEDVIYDVSPNQLLTITEGNTLSNNDFNSFTNFKIFPTIADNQLTITGENLINSNKDFSVEIVNTLGQIIFSKSNMILSNSSIDISKFNSGLYFTNIKYDGLNFTKRFIKK